MWNQVNAYLAPPNFRGKEDKSRIAGLINAFVLALLVTLPLYAVAFIALAPDKAYRLIVLLPFVLLLLALLLLIRRGEVYLAGTMLITASWLLLTITAFISGGVRAPIFGGYTLTVLAAGLLLRRRAALVFAGISLLAGLAMVYAQEQGSLPASDLMNLPLTAWMTQAIILAGAAVVLTQTNRSIDGALASARRDLAERRQAEAALRESEARFRLSFENANVGMCLVDLEGRLTKVNQQMSQIFGYSPTELEGMTVNDIAHPEDLNISPTFIQQAESGQVERTTFEKRYFHKDGHIVWGQVSSSLVRSAQGDPLYFISHVQDFTDRKKAEQELRASEARFRALIENATDMVRVLDPSGATVYVSPSIKRIMGYEPEEMIGRSPFELIHPDDLARVRQGWERAVKLQPTTQGMIEARLRHADGTWHIHEAIGTNLLAEPSVKGFVMNTRDVTEHKRAEAALHQRLIELEAVHAVSSALRVASTLDAAMPIVLDQTLAALETDTGAIWLYHSDGGELRAAVNRGWFCNVDQGPLKPGQGIAGTVFANGQVHASADFACDPVSYPQVDHKIPAGWGGVCVPIRTTAEPVGVLFISVPSPRQITPDQMKLLGSLSEMAGAALHRMRLFEEITRRLKHLQSLHAIDSVITASFDLKITLNVLLEQLTTQLQVDAAAVLLFSPPLQTLDYAAGRGFLTRHAVTIHLRADESLAGRAVVERRVVRVCDSMSPGAQYHSDLARWEEEGFVAYCAVPLIAKGEVKGVLEVYRRTAFSPEPQWLEFLETFGAQAAIAIDNTQLFENQQRSNLELSLAYDATIEGWSRALELRDRETEGHTLRVAEMTVRLARALGIGESEIVQIRRGALLHDIGKMGVSDQILLKPGTLTEEEWNVMRKHPPFAYAMLSPIEYLRPALAIPYSHHEKWDGSGYPLGLKGEQIPLAARLFSVVDVWDALRSDRPYRPAWSTDQVHAYIREQAGKSFDPTVAQTFLKMISAEPG